ncbi:hypothetical protein DAPPUDRAFT_244720 [Daphnia pulex]|uniref:Peptidase S1 domain-containing protein n=1 Tax=Daphnia pulex TaxID=6669 RepID=E9GLM7_DAPPU|nr:hypothetical protein DAPPUDRAFT_244720 [Daphnia pulex]|eukprot:EFX79662.1 hypothetical protein DAPPUDRAFT_244720 [Daphnia pulex]
MARLPQHLAVFLLAVVHLLLFSICPVSSFIYRTKDAVVMEGLTIVGLKRTTSYPVFCGGSIISPSKILTAASCVERASLDEIAKMTVRLGMNTQGDGKTIQHDAQMTRAVTRAVYHIDYNRKTQQNDIAILTVDPPIIYSSAISPVCLPAASSAADQYTGKNAAIMGWGRVNAGGGLSSDLLQAKVKIMANARCKNVWTDAADIFTQQLCASGDGVDICKNDMGGPMIAQLTPASNVWTQIGISSFSDDCLADKPAVFASVAFFRNWINTNLNS